LVNGFDFFSIPKAELRYLIQCGFLWQIGIWCLCTH